MKINVDFIYPIGSIYMSVNSTNPGTLFGGTWSQLKDRFLLGCGNSYANGATGGEASHTLSVSEMPSHRHTPQDEGNFFTGQRWNTSGGKNPSEGGAGSWSGFYVQQSGATGGGQAHNNMPPYLVVYMWKRTA